MPYQLQASSSEPRTRKSLQVNCDVQCILDNRQDDKMSSTLLDVKIIFKKQFQIASRNPQLSDPQI